MIPKRGHAISALVGGQITVNTDGSNAVYHDDQTPPTEAEIDAELKRMQDEYDNGYSRKREFEYPSIQELVVGLYDLDDKADIVAKRAAVKAKYPKPE